MRPGDSRTKRQLLEGRGGTVPLGTRCWKVPDTRGRASHSPSLDAVTAGGAGRSPWGFPGRPWEAGGHEQRLHIGTEQTLPPVSGQRGH